MYIFQLAQRLVYNHLLLHIILVLQIVVSFFLLECMLSTIFLVRASSVGMSELLKANYCYFSAIDPRMLSGGLVKSDDNTSTIIFEDSLRNVDAVLQEETVHIRFTDIGKNSTANLQSEKFLKRIKDDMKYGGAYGFSDYEEGVIRVITNNRSFKLNGYYDAACNVDNEWRTVKVKVVGIVKKSFKYLSSTTAGTYISSADIVETYESVKKFDQYFPSIAFLEDYEKFIGKDIKYNSFKSGSILFSDNISKEDLDYNYSLLNSFGVAAFSDDIVKNNKETNKIAVSRYLPSFIFLLIVGTTSLYSVSVINISRQLKTLALYGVLGCSKRDIRNIVRCYLAIINTAACIIIWILLLLSNVFESLSWLFFNINFISYLLPVAISIPLVFLVSLAPLNLVKKESLNKLRKI